MQKNIWFQDAKMAGFCLTNLPIVGTFAKNINKKNNWMKPKAKHNIG